MFFKGVNQVPKEKPQRYYKMDITDIRIKIIEKLKNADSIVIKTIYEYLTRAEVGKNKYGCTLDRTDLTHEEYLQHLKEELQDGVLYLNKYQEMIKR